MTPETRKDFERWVVTQGRSVERYTKYPYSYKTVELNAMWEAWQESYSYYLTEIAKKGVKR